MRTIDLSPLYRSFIGSDHLASMLDAAAKNEKQTTYPPYNIELVSEDKYRITMAIAGFSESDVEIMVQENTLVVTGNKPTVNTDNSTNESAKQYLHKGISERNFERKFQLGDHVKVLNADMQNGLLNIDLERVIPEAKKPRKIEIGSRLLEN
jgi:molecular chaperone IbpA